LGGNVELDQPVVSSRSNVPIIIAAGGGAAPADVDAAVAEAISAALLLAAAAAAACVVARVAKACRLSLLWSMLPCGWPPPRGNEPGVMPLATTADDEEDAPTAESLCGGCGGWPVPFMKKGSESARWTATTIERRRK
jgi:hypothetical protein